MLTGSPSLAFRPCPGGHPLGGWRGLWPAHLPGRLCPVSPVHVGKGKNLAFSLAPRRALQLRSISGEADILILDICTCLLTCQNPGGTSEGGTPTHVREFFQHPDCCKTGDAVSETLAVRFVCAVRNSPGVLLSINYHLQLFWDLKRRRGMFRSNMRQTQNSRLVSQLVTKGHGQLHRHGSWRAHDLVLCDVRRTTSWPLSRSQQSRTNTGWR